MTTSEILASTRRKLLESGTELVDDTTLLLYANQAYIEVWKRTFTPNVVDYRSIVCSNGICTLPTDYGRMYSFATDTSGNVYNEYSIADYTVSDFEYGFTIREGQMIVSQSSITSITISYYPVPATLTTIQNPTTDPYFHECIVYGAMWRALEDLQDEELSTYYQNKFETELTRRIGNQSSFDETNQRGGQMFMPQTLI